MTTPAWQYRPAADHGIPPAQRWRSVRREPGLISSACHRASRALLAAYFRTYHRLRVIGRANFPTVPPFVVISNHASHLDALALSSALPPALRPITYPVAAGDVFFDTVAISIASAMVLNAVPIWRKKVTTHALDDLRERLAVGDCGFIVFPEGARTRTGDIMPFKAGLGRVVAATGVPVVPCHIRGSYKALPVGAHIPRARRITIRVGEPIRFSDVPNDRTGWETIATRARDAVDALRAEQAQARR